MALSKQWLLIPFVLAMMLKMPSLWPDGRLWAEDGFYLQDAFHLPFWQALTAFHTGYVDITASAAMLIASLASLEHIALISVLMALLIQLCPAILLLNNHCRWLQKPVMIIVGLLLILTPPVIEEIWLSPVTSQYHLMLCAALILAFPISTGIRHAGFQIGLLALAGLSGPGPSLLAPLFILRAILEPSPQRIMQTVALSIGAVIETLIVMTHPEPGRHLTIEAPLLFSVIGLKHFILPLFGRYNMYLMHDHTIVLRIVGIIGLSGLAVMVIKTADRTVSWLFIAALTLMALSYFGALGNKTDLLSVFFGQRYYYTPQVLIGLALLGMANVRSQLAGFFVFWLLAVGLTEYARINPMFKYGASWREEIALWRSDPSHVVTLWPATFKIKLHQKINK